LYFGESLMAKKCQLARDKKRLKLVEQYKDRRNALRKAQIDPSLTEEEREQARFKLSRLPRDSSPSRVTTRCRSTGYARSVYSQFMLNRIEFRRLANFGQLPGVTKASW